ncbi:hypothetical protein QBC39DRAFT_255887 [Podospora conica]|nr:hypothetical protein QBC39DRAFT_255887 [Schizothecium conicum]
MAREKKAAPGLHAKDRHRRDRRGNIIDWTAPLPPGLVARPAMPQPSSKHKSWFELMENKGKKKKLEFQYTESIVPPPGFEFVPAGNPALTTKCKELSREQEAMIFIVTSTTGRFSRALSTHLNRVGTHIRQSIVEKARESLGENQEPSHEANPSVPEPIPQRQEDIDAQADAAIRDLFPRIPNTDRQMIIQHAFNKSNTKNSEPLVGLAADISLTRRVQLAVLAHIRHTHTRYDQLLRETTYVNARKAVEPVCLDILVKWRGDEETGRDQLDEILCEVVVISDSESEDDDDEGDDEDEESSSDVSFSDDAPDRNDTTEQALLPAPVEQPTAAGQPASQPAQAPRASQRPRAHAGRNSRIARKDRRAAVKSHRGFSRYQAARDARDRAWHQAIERQRHDVPEVEYSNIAMADRPVQSNPSPQQPAGFSFGYPTPRNEQDLLEQPRRSGQFYAGWGAPPPRPPIAERERPTHVDGSLQNAAPYGYSLARGGEQRGRSFSPIVGQRDPMRTEPARELVRTQTLDLKDHLVRSIEPYSPIGAQFPPRFPTQGDPPPGRLVANDSGGLREPFAFRQNAEPRYVEVERANGYHVIREQPDFITLSPRREQDRRQPASGRAQAELGQLPQLYNSPRGPVPLGAYQGSWAPQPVVHRDGGMHMTHGQPTLRREARPIWIDDNGAVLRSEQRPIFLDDDAPRPIDRGSGHGQVQVQDDDDDDVQIVKVTNRFPRQHEPQPMPVDPARYELPPRELRSYASPRPVDDPWSYDRNPGAGQPARIERVVARVEVGEPRQQQYDVVPGTTRGADRYPVGPHGRQERVVGIEYLPTGSKYDSLLLIRQ